MNVNYNFIMTQLYFFKFTQRINFKNFLFKGFNLCRRAKLSLQNTFRLKLLPCSVTRSIIPGRCVFLRLISNFEKFRDDIMSHTYNVNKYNYVSLFKSIVLISLHQLRFKVFLNNF